MTVKKNDSGYKLDQLTHEARIWLKKTIIREHPEWLDDQGNCPKCESMYSSLSSLAEGIKNN